MNRLALRIARTAWLRRYKHRKAVVVFLKAGKGRYNPIQRAALLNLWRGRALQAVAAIKSIDAKLAAPAQDAVALKRQKLGAAAMWGVAHEALLHYSEDMSLRFSDLFKPWHVPAYFDCSSFFTTLYKWLGLPDPNGFNFAGIGNTASILNHCTHISAAQLQMGDGIIYSIGTTVHGGDHIAMFTKHLPGGDMQVVSHGGEHGPLLTTHSVEVGAHKDSAGHCTVTFVTLPSWD